MPQHSTEPSPHAGLGALRPNIVASQLDARDGLVNLEPLSQGLEAAMDQGWRPNFWPSSLPDRN